MTSREVRHINGDNNDHRLENIEIVANLPAAGRRLARARAALHAAMDNAEDAARIAWETGETEVNIANTLGVDRMTVRKWRGKL